jgi:hypothetical protein
MKLNYISARGDVLPLAKNEYFKLSHIDGHTAASATISSAVVGGIDGDSVNNVQAEARTIIIDLSIRTDVNVEKAKREILKIVKLKKRGALEWEQDGRNITISGIVEAVTMGRWTNGVIMQITLHCEQPFWEDVDYIVQQINEAISLHYFTDSPADMLYFPEDGIVFGEFDTIRTKSFYNDGDVSVGVEINLIAHDTVTNPIIYDANGNFFGLGYEYESADGGAGIGTALISNPFVMHAGDNVIITTHKGNKTVKHNGVNILDKVKPNSTWLQLETGDNAFNIDSADDSVSNMSFSIVYKQRYI